MQEEPMVGASEAIRTLGIPRVSFYRAVQDGRIPFEEERKPWQKRTVKRFKLSEIRKALDMDTPPSLP
jgi:predicted DNA-binding transcriptional regulator AlpA